MIEVRQTGVFERWLERLKDRTAKLRISQRIDRLRA
jgi:putative component of toxin-antitoxin plasmid stabilization module